MLSDNIRIYRKKNNMSQDELAEKLGISRQSVSLWETGQSQPTIENIIALTKIFNISADTILGNTDNSPDVIDNPPESAPPQKRKSRTGIILLCVIAAASIVCGIIWFAFHANPDPDNSNVTPSAVPQISPSDNAASIPPEASQPGQEFDIFAYCKEFAIEIGTLNGDYSIYQQPAAQYGGYEDEYFSISYWAGSDMVEFCLHCPLNDTYSVNFYLRMRGGYDKKYEYLTSLYYRDDGESVISATGYIDPAVFSDSYPLSCDEYIGSADEQTDFMEESRVGICDLIYCLKNFVEVENMECSFSSFEFVNF